MDLRQLENIIAIENEQSISKAAAKLYITQSALNQQLLKIEKELGTPLFERRKHSMIPTYAGRIYLETAHKMVNMKQDAYKIIHDIVEENAGELAIAYTPERGALMFSHIYPIFHQRYPNITFRIMEGRARDMEQFLLKREVNIAFSTYYESLKNPQLQYMDLNSEYIILALPVTHQYAYLAGEKSWETFPQFDIKLLKDDYWVIASKATRIREMTDRIFNQNSFKPKVLFESTSTSTIVNMVKNQIAPAFIPQSYADPDAPMVYFTVPPIISWMRCVAMLEGNYLTKPEKYLIKLADMQMKGILPPLTFGEPIPEIL